ncbi:MAG: Fe-S protein assembly co-chaperone HscB [Saprospirales bacterium]|nr:Fe-S protein assembly co-chaperone HscB [Saprospirales bacterium]
MNYFEFYRIPVSFLADAAALRRIYYENSKKYHPDYHTLSDPAQQAEMLEKATLNNEAFQTLSDPDRRMRYILEIEGLLQEESRQTLPPEFLLEMMEINESLMELELDFDPARFDAALHDVGQIENALERGIRPVLDGYNGARSDLETVLEYFLKKRYLLRIRENLSKFAPL